jgi:hypothetical protein
MMKVLAAWIMRGPWQATLVVVTATLLVLWLPVLSPVLFLSGAALALVVLRQGAARALKVLLLAMIAGSVLTLFITGSIMPLVWLVLIYWLPLLGLAVVLRITISLDTTVRLLAIAGALAVIVFYLTIGEPSGWLTNPSQQATEAFSADTGIDQTTMLQWLQVVETLVPGLFVASLLMSLLAALLLARWWQSLLYNPGGFRKEFHQLRLGKWLAIIMIVLFVATLISGADVPLIANITLVMSMLYLVQGMAIAHGIVTKLGLSPAWLVAFYILVVFAISQLVIILSVIDAWANFRNRVKTLPGNTR